MKQTAAILILVGGLCVLYPLQRWRDSVYPQLPIGDESLYFSSGETLKKMSLGLDSLVTDVYWIRTVQYFGRKVLSAPEEVRSTAEIRMDLLAPLLNIIVTLDPNHVPAYRFGAIFLPERDLTSAIALLERGIRENPNEWRLYQDIGFIYWHSGDYARAAEWYERGSQIPGARWWMRDLAGLMKIKGGSRNVARQVYQSYLESEDKNIRAQAEARLRQLVALDEIDAINSFLEKQRQNSGACPQDLRVFAPRFKAAGLNLNSNRLPVDPEGYPYEFDQANCRVKLAPESLVPR